MRNFQEELSRIESGNISESVQSESGYREVLISVINQMDETWHGSEELYYKSVGDLEEIIQEIAAENDCTAAELVDGCVNGW